MKSSIPLYSLFFLLLWIGAFSCSPHQQSSPSSPGATSSPEPQVLAPRVDSVLQFTSMITEIFEDSKGNYWFGSHKDGLCCYDGSQFTYYTVDQGLPDARVLEFDGRSVAMGNSIRTIQEDSDGNIWLGTGDGVSKFDGHHFTTIHPQKEPRLITEKLAYASENPLWFGEAEMNGAYRLDGGTLTHVTFPIPSGLLPRRASSYASYSLYTDRSGNQWFGTESGGILQLNPQGFSCINPKGPKGIVRSIFQDKDDRIWISNVTIGLFYFEDDSLTNFTEANGFSNFNTWRSNPDASDSETLDGIQTIAQATNGDLWFGTFGEGVWRYDGTNFTHFTTENGLPSDTVKTIYLDSSGQLWFGIGRGTVYSFNGKSFERFDGKEAE